MPRGPTPHPGLARRRCLDDGQGRGGREREIRIWLDPLKLAGWGIAVDDILMAIRREHLDLPGGRIETDLRAARVPVVMRYFDPNYIIRSSRANAEDSILSDLFARNAVHAAMAGRTGVVIGYLHNEFIHVPVELLTSRT